MKSNIDNKLQTFLIASESVNRLYFEGNYVVKLNTLKAEIFAGL